MHLTDYLAPHKDGIAADRFASLAEDTFQEGVSILQQALAIYKAVELDDPVVLQKDMDRLKRQRASINDNNPGRPGHRHANRIVPASHRARVTTAK